MKVEFEFFDRNHTPNDGSSILISLDGESSADDLYPAIFKEGRFFLDMGSEEDVTEQVGGWTYNSISGTNASLKFESFYVIGREEGGKSTYLFESSNGWELTDDWELATRFSPDLVEVDEETRELRFKSAGEDETYLSTNYLMDGKFRLIFCEAGV